MTEVVWPLRARRSTRRRRRVWSFSATTRTGSESVPIAPWGKHATFVLGSRYEGRDDFYRLYAQRSEPSNGSRGRVFQWDPSALELTIHHSVRNVGEDRNSRGHAAVHEVGRLEHPGAKGIARDHDDVDRPDWVIGHEYPSGLSQNRRSGSGNGRDCRAEHQYRPEHSSP